MLQKDQSAPPAAVETEARARGMTRRVVLLCLGLAAFFGYVIPIVDVKLSNTFMGAQHLPPSAIGVLLVLLLVVNPLLQLLGKRFKFSRAEMLTVYISCLFSTLVPGHGGETLFMSQMLAPFYYATRENGWVAQFQGHLQPWMSPALWADGGTYGAKGQEVVAGWFNGLPPGASVPWAAWLVPLAAWGILIFAMYAALACLSVMLRAQWGEHEALAFPLLRLPLEMTEDVDSEAHGTLGRFFSHPLLWVGMGVAVFIQLVNGLHLYYPDVPPISMSLDMAPYLVESPWNQIGSVPIFVWPIVVGITYLLTSEVSFSLWFFYWFIKFQLLVGYVAGLGPATAPDQLMGWGKAFTGFERVGAWFGYVALVLWTGRRHFWHIARRALGREAARPGEENEALSYPVAFWGFLASSAIIVVWGVLAGVRADIALAIWVGLLVMFLGLTRLVVEAGILLMTPNWMPLGVFGQLFNAGPGRWLSVENGLIPANFFSAGMAGDPRAFSMPSFVQGFKLAHDHKIPGRPLLALIGAVMLISWCLSCWMRVKLGYANGALGLGSWFFVKVGSQLPAWWSDDLMNGVKDAGWLNAAWLSSGALLMLVLMAARARFSWFPLHPIGFLISVTWAMEQLWFSVFVGWACKVLITKFGGNSAYRKATPLFLGFVLGDVLSILFWICVDGYTGRMGHHLTPD